MASRKQRIKSRRTQEEREIRQVRIAVVIFVVIIIVAVGAYVAYDSGVFSPSNSNIVSNDILDPMCDQATPAPQPATNTFPAADQVLQPGVDYQAIMCTDIGAIYLDLYETRTPVTVNNFVFLANNNFYNNTIFHRVIADFMAQGGDPTGTGTGGPGYQFQDEFLPDLTFDRPYLLAMANAGPGTNGSQFFITFVPTPHLNGMHTIFGEVISGHQVVDNIMLRDPQIPNAPATTLQTVLIVTPDMVSGQ